LHLGIFEQPQKYEAALKIKFFIRSMCTSEEGIHLADKSEVADDGK
jgi:hypothetical protein